MQVWRSTLWSDIKTEIMEEGTKNFVKEVKSLNKKVRDDDCFKVRHQVGPLVRSSISSAQDSAQGARQ